MQGGYLEMFLLAAATVSKEIPPSLVCEKAQHQVQQWRGLCYLRGLVVLSRRNWVLLHQKLMGTGSRCLYSLS